MCGPVWCLILTCMNLTEFKLDAILAQQNINVQINMLVLNNHPQLHVLVHLPLLFKCEKEKENVKPLGPKTSLDTQWN